MTRDISHQAIVNAYLTQKGVGESFFGDETAFQHVIDNISQRDGTGADRAQHHTKAIYASL